MPRPGDYGVLSARPVGVSRLVPAAIRLVTRSRWNHAYVVVHGGYVVEATPRGARLAPMAEYTGCEVAYNDEEPKTVVQRDAIVAAAMDLVGTPYNFVDILALGLAGLGQRSKWLRERVHNCHGMICSQLVDEAYLRAGVHLYDDGRLPGDVTPGDLADRITERSWESRK